MNSRGNSNLVMSLVIVGLLGFVLAAWGAISINWPWGAVDDIATHRTEITYDAPARIVEIEPIGLDCRARVHAEVPVEGSKEHKLFGQVYRTDTVGLLAVGDVDTCVDADAIEIATLADGTTTVTIPAEAITFERPRVDAIATKDSVQFDKGLVGKLTDAFPWVSDNSGLTPAGYAFAQTVIGGSDCMQSAYDVTEDILVNAFIRQADEKGFARGAVTVDIVGTPDFEQNETPETLDDDYDFESLGDKATCSVADDRRDGLDPIPTPEPIPSHDDPRV